MLNFCKIDTIFSIKIFIHSIKNVKNLWLMCWKILWLFLRTQKKWFLWLLQNLVYSWETISQLFFCCYNSAWVVSMTREKTKFLSQGNIHRSVQMKTRCIETTSRVIGHSHKWTYKIAKFSILFFKCWTFSICCLFFICK